MSGAGSLWLVLALFGLAVAGPASADHDIAPPGSFSVREGNPSPGYSGADLAMGHLDDDGHLDLVTVKGDNLTPPIPGEYGLVDIFLGDGDGGFADAPGSPHLLPNEAAGVNAVAVGDFDGQQAEDIAAGDRAGNVHVLLSQGSGEFAPAATSPVVVANEARGLAAADFDGDSDLDLAVATVAGETGPGEVEILLGDGSGGFAPAPTRPQAAGQLPWDLVVEDFNRDMDQDLAVLAIGSDDVTILLGDGAGGFASAPTIEFGSDVQGLAVGDFDRDLDADLAIPLIANYGTRRQAGKVHIRLGDGAGGFETPPSSPVRFGRRGPFAIVSGQLNGRGGEDLAVSLLSVELAVLLARGGGDFRQPSTSPMKNAVETAIAGVSGDFDEGGDADLALLNDDFGALYVLLNLASQQSDLSLAVTDMPDPVAVGDAITYTIGVENEGTDQATRVKLRARLGAKRIAPRADCSQKRNRAGPRIRCTLGWLDPGETGEVELVVDAGEDPGMIASRFRVSAQQLDLDHSDDRAVVETRVRRNLR